MEKLIKYRFVILQLALFVALMLMIPSIQKTITSIQFCNERLSWAEEYMELRNQCYVLLAEYICYALACAILFILSIRRTLEKKWIILVIVIYYLAKSAVIVYSIVTEKDYSQIYFILNNILIIVFTIVSFTNIRYRYFPIFLLLTDAAFSLCEVFTGSQVGLSNLLLSLMLLWAIIIYSKQTESEYRSNYIQ